MDFCTLSNELVSVVIPVHNRFQFADEGIGFVLNQTYRPIELIIVDDCSEKPYIPKIISEEGFEIKVARNNVNKGPGASRESGRQAAHGVYIAYLDSDDLWHPKFLEKHVSMLQAHPEAGMCYCQSILFSRLPLTGVEPLRKNSNLKINDFLPIVLDVRPWCTSACLWTRQAISKIGPWFNSWHFEDVEYDTRAGCNEVKICYVPEILCYYRLNEDGGSLSNTLSKFSIRHQTRSMLQIGENLKRFNKIKDKEIEYFFTKRLFKTAFEATNCGEKKSAIKLFWKMLEISSNFKKKMIALLLLGSCMIFPVNSMNSLKYRLKKVF